ncbi:hypothetical protein KI387_016569, partial [Taxus chinensis]
MEIEFDADFVASDEETSGADQTSLLRRTSKRNLQGNETVKSDSETERDASIIMNSIVGVIFDEKKLGGEGLDCAKLEFTEDAGRTSIEEIVEYKNKSAGCNAYSVSTVTATTHLKPQTSVYYADEQGLWKCHHCTWVYPAIKAGLETIQKHKEHCEGMTHEKAPFAQVFPIKHEFQKGSEMNVILDRGSEYIDCESKDTEFVMSEMVIQTMNEIEKNQKFPITEGNWKINYVDSEASTGTYVTQSFVKGKFNHIEKTEKGKGACLDTHSFSEIGITPTGMNGEPTTNEVRKKPENAGVKEHQQGNSVSEIILQNSQDRYAGLQDDKQLKEHWTRILEKNALEGKVEDVVNILKEQESHDVICPVCKSCITKRIILRKRKRTNLVSDDRWHREGNDDVQGAVPEGEHDITEDRNDRQEISNEDDDKAEAYGCLTCFSLIFRGVTGVKFFRTKSESGNNNLVDQYPSEMCQDSRMLVQKEKDSFYCLSFLNPWGHNVNKESKPVAEEEFMSGLPNQTAGHPGSPIQSIRSQTSTTTKSTISYSRSMENVEIREKTYTGTEIEKSIQYLNGCSEFPQLEEHYLHLPNVEKTEDQHTMPTSSSKLTTDDQTGQSKKIIEVTNESVPVKESDEHCQRLDKLAESTYMEKQHPYQKDVKGTGDQLTEPHFDGSATLSEEQRQVKTEQRGVYTSSKPVDMLPREVETIMDEGIIHPYLATQEQASNELSAAAQDEELSRNGQQADNVEDIATGQGQTYKKDYLCSCIPVSIPAVWSIWSSKESISDQQLTEPLLVNIKDRETFDMKVPVALKDDQQRDLISPLKLDSVESSSSFETQDPSSLAKGKVDDSVFQSSKISPDSGKIVVLKDEMVATVIDIRQSDDIQPSIADTTVPELTEISSTQVLDRNVVTDWDILKSIVYGGLTVSITSLGVVSSAAGGEADTLIVIAIGLSNLIAGLFLIFNNILYLDHFHRDEFLETVGHRFWFNGFVAILSYLIFGSLAPITYGFSFRKSDDRVYKFLATSLLSLLSIVLLALGKARVTKKSYIRIVILYIVTGFWASIIGFFA